MKQSYIYSLHHPKREEAIPCEILFSKRKSLSVQIGQDAAVKVRAPYFVTRKQIANFLEEKKEWIFAHQEKMQERRAAAAPVLSPLEERQAAVLKKRFLNAAREYIPSRCEELQKLTGGYYTRITIRDQKTRWGSCSQTGTLSFNYRLMMAPRWVIDYVIVHELCHLTYLNHSRDFWNKVATVLPDYRSAKQWLKLHGNELTEAHYLLSLM